ncbi:MAG TPA: M23 family metallopeptidase, partial [Amaricoccus sp.]|nr:M23 family metallopeptidase [Amaricoccus sp.]
VEPGETAYSVARLYGVSVTALASWNGLGPDLALREGQELLIPIVSDANRISSSASLETQPGQGTPVAPPPSAAAPLPADITAAVEPESPNLGALRTPPGGRLSPPVSGKIARPYDGKNGVGFAVPAGTPVKAAAPGEVAMVSEALGGLGAIVLVRHKDDLITTYSTLADVRVQEGETVRAGQVLGVVAQRDDAGLQFDVFRGVESVDPTPYLGGGG